MTVFKFCPQCAQPLAWLTRLEDGGEKQRLCCTACDFTHWNNPIPVLAAVVEYEGQILLAQNVAWPTTKFALITGFMEANDTPQEGIIREIREETNLHTNAVQLIGVYEAMRMNHVIIAYHAVCEGDIRLSPELANYRLFAFDKVQCWPSGTGYALADWLRLRGYEPEFRPLILS